MQRYEFKVVPAPRRAEKAKGVKSTEDRFALTLAQLMNELGAQGWDYVRADALPCDERSGLTGIKTSYQNLLIFRRPLGEAPVAIAAVERLEEGPIKTLGPAREPEEGPSPNLGPAIGPAI